MKNTLNNLEGYNNKKLLEEVGLINRIKEAGRRTKNNIKAGTQGLATGFGDANDYANDLDLRSTSLRYSPDEDNSNKFFGTISTNSQKYKNFSDSEKKMFDRGQATGVLTNGLGRLGLAGVGAYTSKKLEDYLSGEEQPDNIYDDVKDDVKDVYNNTYDNVNDVYDNVHDVYDNVVN